MKVCHPLHYPADFHPYAVVLNLTGWSFYFIPISQSKSTPLCWCRSHWDHGSYWSILYSAGSTRCQSSTSFCCWCSTSLGTTFTVHGSSGLSIIRLGIVLTSAAMMDDVVGSVMVQLMSNLGDDDFNWVTVVRLVLDSVAFAVVAPIICHFVAKSSTMWLNAYCEAHPDARLDALLQRTQTALTIHTLIPISLITGATYAGTSNLFAAYIGGASTSWWDSDVLMAFAKVVCGLWLVRFSVSSSKKSPSKILSKVRLRRCLTCGERATTHFSLHWQELLHLWQNLLQHRQELHQRKHARQLHQRALKARRYVPPPTEAFLATSASRPYLRHVCPRGDWYLNFRRG
jgi:hypothetical protein